MHIPLSLLGSLQDTVGFSQENFVKAHEQPVAITSVRVNPLKPLLAPPSADKVPWSDLGYYLAERPSFTFDPLFHAGTYYVQEASSMFLEQAMRQTLDLKASLNVLDLCAAPGGKSTHLQSLLGSGSLLVSNEVIRSRVSILEDNLVKWGAANVMVTNNDPKDFSRLPHFFDAIVVDAPCSGSGLFRREPEAIDEWSTDNVALCSLRQQRILADCWECLKPGGILVYSTCSYSPQEDEDNFDWVRSHLHAAPVGLKLDPAWGITDTGKGYRFWPDKLRGEGFYLAVFRKAEEPEIKQLRVKKRPDPVSKKDHLTLEGKIITEGMNFIQYDKRVYAWPASIAERMALVLQEMKVICSGVLAGELMHGKLVPAHSLAMSKLILPSWPYAELNRDQAIRYLQKKELDPGEVPLGWTLAAFEGHPLGWMNVLKNRINNYYPLSLRIRKEA